MCRIRIVNFVPFFSHWKYKERDLLTPHYARTVFYVTSNSHRSCSESCNDPLNMVPHGGKSACDQIMCRNGSHNVRARWVRMRTLVLQPAIDLEVLDFMVGFTKLLYAHTTFFDVHDKSRKWSKINFLPGFV